jgi:histidine triad (HIT) family protein
MATIFSKIVAGEVPCFKVAETTDFLAFLDINPVALGHTLCIPKLETDYIFDLSDADLSGLVVFTKRVAMAVEAEVSCLRCGLAVVGLEVPHTHVHIIPMQSMADFSFGNKLQVPASTLSDLAARISGRYNEKGF